MSLPKFVRNYRRSMVVVCLAICTGTVNAQNDDAEVKASYTKVEQMIAMRDGVKLFTSIYVPRDTSQKIRSC